MPKKIRDVPDYLPEQMDYEEQYYQDMVSITAGLITWLLANMENNPRVNIATLDSVYQTWLQQQDKLLYGVARRQAVNIVNLAAKTVGNDAFIRNRELIESLTAQIQVVQRNMYNSLFGQFVVLLPIGIAGIYSGFFTDDTTKADIYTRSTSHIKGLCVNTYGQGVFNTILLAAKLKGYSQYLGDNKHDSRVRELHRKYFNGEDWIDFDNPPPCGHIATERNCRCRILRLR